MTKEERAKRKVVNLKIQLSTHQLLMNEKAKTYTSINDLVEAAIIKVYK